MNALDFAAEFHKFKITKPKWKDGHYTVAEYGQWQEEYFQKFLGDVRQKALSEAIGAVAKLDTTTNNGTRSAILAEARQAIREIK